HAHGRAGVSTIERLRWSLHPRPNALHFNGSVFALVRQALPLAAEFGHAVKRAGAIAGRGKIMETARTLGNRRQHGVAVRNGLVSGNAHDSTHPARAVDDDIQSVRLRIIAHEFNITEFLTRAGQDYRALARPAASARISCGTPRSVT